MLASAPKEPEPILDENARRILEARYLERDPSGRVVETPRELLWRVARGVAAAESAFGCSPDEASRAFYPMLASLDFLPNSPTLMNAGRATGQLSACFVLPVEDSMEAIFETLKSAALIQRTGGGTGFSFSRLRPKDDLVARTGGRASGPVSFMRVFNSATDAIHQGGVRRGANMAMLRVDHPDVLSFIDVKGDPRELENFNVSVSITDAFMQAVKDGTGYELRNPRTGEPAGTLDARGVFERIVQRAWATGEPGVVFIDRVNAVNPTPQLGEMESMNPCAELPLLPYESCNLGSVNVARFVRDGAIDWSRLRGTIHLAVRFLDDVIEANRYPLPAIEAITKSNRKIGLGVMGFADLLVQLGVRYDSERALAVADELASFVQREARAASEELARARGPFPAWPGSLWAQRGDLPRRNATVSTVAPTGTISLIAGCSSGIEPLFALAYVRRALDGEALLRFVHPALGRVARERGFWSEELAESVARTGSLAHVESVPDEVRDVFRTSHEIAPEWHVRMQAAFQRHVENAVSKCIAEGTLIPTSRGLIRIESFSDIDTEGTFVPVTSGVTTGGRRVVSHYWQGVKPATRIRLDNGATLVGSTESHRVMTPEGWRRLVDLEPGDLVLGEFQESHGDGAQPIGWESAYRTNAKRVRVPERMSPTFAKFLGMLAADGHTVESTGNVGLTVADPVVEAEFIRLCEMLFEVTPRIVKDTRNDVRTASITSRNLARCVEMLIGKGAYEKRIPEQVLRGNPEEKLAFLTGLTLDGYVTRDGLCVYAGMSEELAYHASEICRSFGVPLVRVQRVFVKATDAWGWRVVVSNELQRRIVAIEAHKNVAATDVAFKVLVSPEDVARRSLSTKDPGYHNLRLLKQTSKPFCKNTVADELGLAWRRLVHRVSIVEDAGLVNLYDIEVEGDHTYVANGIVSHNTINLPTTATPDDVKRAYLLAYESGCKGITVYRDGSREAQVLSVPSSAPVAAGRKPRPRPEVTKGMTIKRRTGEGNLYVTINEDERGQPFELFATLGKAGGCMAAMTEAIARLVSLALRAGVDVDEVRKQLRGISCHPAWNDGVKVLSSPDAIAQAIELWQREKGHPVSDEVAPTRSGCPECGGTLEHAEGCTTCRACGFSECG